MKPENYLSVSVSTASDDPERVYLTLNAEIETKRLQISRIERQKELLLNEVKQLESRAGAARSRAVAL